MLTGKAEDGTRVFGRKVLANMYMDIFTCIFKKLINSSIYTESLENLD